MPHNLNGDNHFAFSVQLILSTDLADLAEQHNNSTYNTVTLKMHHLLWLANLSLSDSDITVRHHLTSIFGFCPAFTDT